MALKIALEGAQELGVETRILDLPNCELTFCDGCVTPYPAGVQRLCADVQRAQEIILATPEYHAGLSSVLKNALDLMGFKQFGGKMLGLIRISGGWMGAINALNSLRAVGHSLHAWAIPQQVAIPQAWKVFEDDGSLKDEAYRERLHEVGQQVARFAYLHTAQQIQEFLQSWETGIPNPGV